MIKLVWPSLVSHVKIYDFLSLQSCHHPTIQMSLGNFSDDPFIIINSLKGCMKIS